MSANVREETNEIAGDNGGKRKGMQGRNRRKGAAVEKMLKDDDETEEEE